MFNLFKRNRPVTASEIGRLGASIRKQKERKPIREQCDRMREKLGLEPVRWPE